MIYLIGAIFLSCSVGTIKGPAYGCLTFGGLLLFAGIVEHITGTFK